MILMCSRCKKGPSEDAPVGQGVCESCTLIEDLVAACMEARVHLQRKNDSDCQAFATLEAAIVKEERLAARLKDA